MLSTKNKMFWKKILLKTPEILVQTIVTLQFLCSQPVAWHSPQNNPASVYLFICLFFCEIQVIKVNKSWKKCSSKFPVGSEAHIRWQ